MSPRRENLRKGWIILSAGRPWDDWVYPSEAAAQETADRCRVKLATVVEGHLQGTIDAKKRQYGRKMLYDSKMRYDR